MNKAIENKDEVLDLIMSNLSYGVTGDDDILYMSSIEQQLKDLDEEMDRTVKLSHESKGDSKRFHDMIGELCRQMTALRQELELVKAKLAADDKVSAEIERIKNMLSDENIKFNEYE